MRSTRFPKRSWGRSSGRFRFACRASSWTWAEPTVCPAAKRGLRPLRLEGRNDGPQRPVRAEGVVVGEGWRLVEHLMRCIGVTIEPGHERFSRDAVPATACAAKSARATIYAALREWRLRRQRAGHRLHKSADDGGGEFKFNLTGSGALSSATKTIFTSFGGRGPGSNRSGRLAARRALALSSSSVVGQRMVVSFGVELHDGLMDGAIEVFRSPERLMGEVMPLQVAPDRFDVVELGSIFRKPFDPEPVGALGERGAGRLAGVDRAVVENEHERLDRTPELGTIAAIDLLQESDEVRASFGPAGVNDELALRPVEHPEHRHFGALARRWNAQIGPSFGPDMRQVRMGERFGLVAEEQHDVARFGLGFEQLPAQARPVHRVRVLASLQRVARTAPAESPLWRSITDSREQEMRTPARVSIASTNRGSVQFGRSATGPDRTSSATARARSALTGAGPGATDFFRASMPPVMKVLRQNRTVSSRTPKASAIWLLVQPNRVSKIARARSASPRSREWLRAISPCLCSSSTTTGDLPTMIPIPDPIKRRNHSPHPLARPSTPA